MLYAVMNFLLRNLSIYTKNPQDYHINHNNHEEMWIYHHVFLYQKHSDTDSYLFLS